MFLERLQNLLAGAFHRRPNHITVTIASAQAISNPVQALPPGRMPRQNWR